MGHARRAETLPEMARLEVAELVERPHQPDLDVAEVDHDGLVGLHVDTTRPMPYLSWVTRSSISKTVTTWGGGGWKGLLARCRRVPA